MSKQRGVSTSSAAFGNTGKHKPKKDYEGNDIA
jgi:hypothetical protein